VKTPDRGSSVLDWLLVGRTKVCRSQHAVPRRPAATLRLRPRCARVAACLQLRRCSSGNEVGRSAPFRVAQSRGRVHLARGLTPAALTLRAGYTVHDMAAAGASLSSLRRAGDQWEKHSPRPPASRTAAAPARATLRLSHRARALRTPRRRLRGRAESRLQRLTACRPWYPSQQTLRPLRPR